MIKKIQTSEGFKVFFPFELKDTFKKTFKTAKWNPSEKCWEVGPKSGKKLDQWIELAQPAVDDISSVDEAELSEAELIELQAQITEVRAQTAKVKAAVSTLAAAVDLLREAQADLKKAQAELDAAKQEQTAQMRLAKETLGAIIDINAVCLAHTTMMRCGRVGSAAREKWDNAQAVLKVAREQLKTAGFVSQGIDTLYYLNFNRADRDKPQDVWLDDIYKISKVS